MPLNAYFYSHLWIETEVIIWKHWNRAKLAIFWLCDLEIWQIASKNNRWSIPCSWKLCVSFHNHPWIQIVVIVRKHSNQSQIGDILAVWPWNLTDDIEKQQGTSPMLIEAMCVISLPSVDSNWSYRLETLKSEPCLFICNCEGRLLYAPKSFVLHVTAIRVLKLLSSENAEIRDKLAIFGFVTLKFDRWPPKTIGNLSSSYACHLIIICELKLELLSANAQIRAKSSISASVTLKLNGWPQKTIGHLFYVTSKFCTSFPETPNSGQTFFVSYYLEKLRDYLEKQYATSSTSLQALCVIS